MKDKKNSVLKALKKWEYLRDYEEFKKIDKKLREGLGHQRNLGFKEYVEQRKNNGRQGIRGAESGN